MQCSNHGQITIECYYWFTLVRIEKLLLMNKMLPTEVDLKQFLCYICNGKFTSDRNILWHMKSVHKGQKPFLCFICDQRFAMKRRLKEHISYVHEGKKLHMFSICNSEFAYQNTLVKSPCRNSMAVSREIFPI